MGRELPRPGSKELSDLITKSGARLVYEFLYERRDNPPTQVEIDEFVSRTLGKPQSQTERRRRELTEFGLDVEKVQLDGDQAPGYKLVGFLPDAEGRRARKPISKRVRAEVLQRYHARCALCGRNTTEDGVKLAIDHKVPLDWGDWGDTDPDDIENLQPLCEDCNGGKKALFATYDDYGDAIQKALQHDDPWTRIGELLKALQGQEVPDFLVHFVAKEENQGDYKKRARELRFILDWDLHPKKRKVGNRWETSYVLTSWQPWPPEGARAAVLAYEKARVARNKAKRGAGLEQ